MRNTQLRGHGLLYEGAAYDGQGGWLGRGRVEGHGLCSCGAQSPWLPTTAARKRWMDQHKAEVRAQMQNEEG